MSGGGEVVAFEQAYFLAQMGHEVTIVTTRASFISESDYFKNFKKRNKHIKYKYINVPESLKWIYEKAPGVDWQRWNEESLHVGRLALMLFIKHKYDIIALHNVLDSIAAPIGSKSVLHLHGYPPEVDSLQKTCLTIPSALVADSEFIKEEWDKMTDLPECGITRNGIRSNYFVPNPKRVTTYDVLYMGRLIPIKGVSYLIEAISKIKQTIPNIKVGIAGRGPEKENLESLAQKLGCAKNINFLGYINDADLLKLYQSSKIAVLPSYDREGILTTMLEAASCGLPVITTTACSMHEFLKNNENGILVRPKDSLDIANAIIRLMKNEKLRTSLGNAARKDIVENWDWNLKIKDVENIYEKVRDHN